MNPETTTTAHVEQPADTDADVPAELKGTYVPPMLLVVFGAPVLLTLVWFFTRFTAPDRFGRVNQDTVPDEPDDGLDASEDPQPDETGGEPR